MSNFLKDATPLDFPKADLYGVPPGADATKYGPAASWNGVCQALYDVRAYIKGDRHDVTLYGAKGDGSTDDTTAINLALAAVASAGGTVYFPTGDYIYTGTLVTTTGMSIVGDGFPSSDSSNAPTLRINAGANPAIRVEAGPVRIANLQIRNHGGTGLGIRATRTLHMASVRVRDFQKANLLLEQDLTFNGAYYSSIVDCTFQGSWEHGAVVGRGANAVTLINCRFFHNGFQSQIEDVGHSNGCDGIYVGTAYNPNSVGLTHPEAVTIIGGDSSYNCQYGWNIDDCIGSSAVQPGYAEFNHSFGSGAAEYAYQAHTGRNVRRSFISFAWLTKDQVFLESNNYKLTEPSTIMVGGTPLAQARDLGGTTDFFNFLNLKQYWSANSDYTNIVIQDPDTATGNCVVHPFGAAVLTLGTGATTLVIAADSVGTSAGFTVGTKLKITPQGSAPAGPNAVGEVYTDTSGRPYTCTAAGTPGTWTRIGSNLVTITAESGNRLGLSGGSADGATAIGVKVGNSVNLATDGAKIVEFYQNASFSGAVCNIDYHGGVNSLGRSAWGLATNTPGNGGTYTPDARTGNSFVLTGATSGGGFTVAAPTNPVTGQTITFTIKNTGGGAHTTTWNAAYKMATWTDPSTGNQASISFLYDGSTWHEVHRSSGTIAN